MNYQYIEQLLERYWQCQTTLEEEQILRSFFSQPDVPEHLKPYADLFAFEAQQQQETLSEDFEQRILDAIGEEKPAVQARKVKFTQRLTPLFKAAAVVAVALTIGNVCEHAMQQNAAGNAATIPTGDTYTKKEDITAKIKIIDQNRANAIAKTDSLASATVGVDNSNNTIAE